MVAAGRSARRPIQIEPVDLRRRGAGPADRERAADRVYPMEGATMRTGHEVVVLSGVRTAIGGYGGTLKEKPPAELAAAVVREVVRRAGIEPAEVGHVAFGNVIHTDPHDLYLSRFAAVRGGLPVETPAVTVNRLCGSGLQAIVSAAQLIQLGEAEAAIGGGAECMSRAPYWLPSLRWGQRMN